MENDTYINIDVKVDPIVKEKAEILFEDLGIDMDTAINIFLCKCINTSSIPFSISLKPED